MIKKIKTIVKQYPSIVKCKIDGKNKYVINTRSKKYGLNTRYSRFTEKEARVIHEHIRDQVINHGKHGSQLDATIDDSRLRGNIYRLNAIGYTIEQAVNLAVNYHGKELKKSILPTVQVLSQEWLEYKLGNKQEPIRPVTICEYKTNSRWITRHFGNLKPNQLTKQVVEKVFNSMSLTNTNTTKKKYKSYLGNFCKWVKSEKSIEIIFNSNMIKIKTELPCKEIFTPDQIGQMLQLLNNQQPELVPFYIIAAFVGARTSEIKRMKWEDLNFETNEIYISKLGKTGERRAKVDQCTMAYLKSYKEKNPDALLIPIGMHRKEKLFHASVENELKIPWYNNGLRHTAATQFYKLHKNWDKVEENFGHSAKTSRRSYQRAISEKDCTAFWELLKRTSPVIEAITI